jgi:hypothetical protein
MDNTVSSSVCTGIVTLEQRFQRQGRSPRPAGCNTALILPVRNEFAILYASMPEALECHGVPGSAAYCALVDNGRRGGEDVRYDEDDGSIRRTPVYSRND